MKRIALSGLLCMLCGTVFGQPDSTEGASELQAPAPRLKKNMASVTGPKLAYNPKVDLSISIPATVFTLYGFSVIYSKPEIDSSIVANLTKDDIPSFDRWAVKTNQRAAEVSDLFFYGSMPYPLLFLLDKDIRKDGGRYVGLYWEAMTITGVLYTGSNLIFDRYRPETYETSLRVKERQDGGNKNSFFAGHVAVVGTSTFFAATVYDMYHPTSKAKWAFYGIAAAATGATIYLRHDAGKHFPSDLLVGTIVGVGSGMLVPRLHRQKPWKKTSWHLSPSVSPLTGDGYGLAATYRF